MDSKSQYTAFKRTIEEYKRAAREQYERRIQALDAALEVAEEIGLERQPVEVMESSEVSVAVKRDTPVVAVPDMETAHTPEQHPMWEAPHGRNGGSRPFKLKDEVIKAYKGFNGEPFRQLDVTHILRERFPEQTVYSGSVTSTLTRLVDQGMLRLVKPAAGGSDPAIFQEVGVSP